MKKPKVEFIVSYLEQYLENNHNCTVLELGCGTTQYKEIIGTGYLGLDIEQNSTNSVDIIRPASSTGLASNSVDLIFTVAMLYLSGQHLEILNESYRILKPGGRIVIFDYNSKTQKKLQTIEGHRRYPCWSRLGLRKILKENGFVSLKAIPVSNKTNNKILNFIKDIYGSYRYSWICIEGKKIKV